MPAPLTVYRASAGAGKTFRLVVEYIKLLMLRPDNYKHILAVTFTKKATQEMKIRILSQLYGLKEGLHSSDSYMKCITEEMNVREGEVRKTAAQSLSMILKDYNHFRIETIDSFFQSVLRNMARELDISSNMRVEINGEQVKDKAVDQLIDNLEPGDRLVECLQRFANENMEEGKTWNIISSLKEFGSSIFSDFYKSHSAEYKSRMRENPNLFVEYKSKLYAIKGQAQKNILDAAESLRLLIEDTHGLDINMFKYSSKSGLGKLYEYLLKGEYMRIPATLNKYAADENEWFNKKDAARYGTAVIANSLMPALQDYLRIHERMIHDMTSSNVLLSNLNSLELLADIEAAVDESNLKANRFMLSSTNQLLSEMIGESDSPFIYEKIGTRVEHLMIDEFQDTSTLQWRNFKKLLLESMSYYDAETARGSVGSMIVGDVKQSIYRWRDGDWNILNGIKGEFANDADTDVRTLGTNYRSEANIINFNNGFFNRAKQVVGIESAYSDVTQQVGRTGEACGEIEITMLTEEEYKARHLMIAQKVSDLMTKYGVKAKDIAILGRNNSILKDLSKTFMEHFPDIHVVSMESFMLNTSSAVCAIVCALRLTQKPTDRILLATLAQYSGMSEVEVAKSVAGLNTRKPIFDVVEDIYRTFHIDRMADDAAFVSAFFDYLKNFAAQNTATIRNFLKQWDEVISDKAIETEATDGVQMMTIHKSKGLEFHNVIVADGNWSTKVDQNRIWVEIGEPPFNDIPFAKLRPSKQLENSIFEEEYREECVQNDVDNINLLYVAFTRAGKNLYYYGQTSKKKEGLNNELPPKEYLKGGMSGVVEQTVLTATLDDGSGILHAPTHTYIYDEEGNTCGYTLHYGDFAIDEKKKAEKKNDRVNVFDMAVSPLTVPIHTSTSRAVFLQSNRSRQFVDEDDATSYISIGKLMHNVLSQIITLDDVDRVLTSLEHEGVITDRNLSVLLRRRIMESEHAQQWFAEGWTVYNECAILTAEGEKRPDRVITDGTRTIVIDYKFGNQKDEYREQVTTYKHLLEQIGMPNVSAYLWYVYTDTVVNV